MRHDQPAPADTIAPNGRKRNPRNTAITGETQATTTPPLPPPPEPPFLLADVPMSCLPAESRQVFRVRPRFFLSSPPPRPSLTPPESPRFLPISVTRAHARTHARTRARAPVVLFRGYIRTPTLRRHYHIYCLASSRYITFAFVGERVTDERCVDEVRRLG
jgi:hypothetical protein